MWVVKDEEEKTLILDGQEVVAEFNISMLLGPQERETRRVIARLAVVNYLKALETRDKALRRQKEVTCAGCGGSFVARRLDQKHHDAACRMRAFRARSS